ncbi:MAG: TonB-dependent receptor [Flammeovirgaceae bacterium]|nr:TonB-dependent receptor [Flammeovirgaceae bacterium]
MKKWTLFCIWLCFSLASYSQKDCLEYDVNGVQSYDSVSLTSFIHYLHDQTTYKVYMNDSTIAEMVDQKYVTSLFISKTTNCIQSAFDFFLAPQKNVFIEYLDEYVFITKDVKLFTVRESFLIDDSEDLNELDSGSRQGNTGDLLGLMLNPESVSRPELIELGDRALYQTDQNVKLSGYVREESTGEPLIGVSVHSVNGSSYTTTNRFGYYELLVISGNHTIQVNYSGKQPISQAIRIYSSASLDFEMIEKVVALNEVVISADRDRNVDQPEMGIERLEMSKIAYIPKVLGENDILKVILARPGVKSVGEGAQGFNVRGGNADQNLVLFDGAPVYNSSHFFGFFSIFNADIIGSTELYKSLIPAQYGGRLSSVLDIRSRVGNQEEVAGVGGINPISARLTVDVPIIKDKLNVIAGMRRTHSSWILSQFKNTQVKNSDASFYDLTFKSRYTIDSDQAIDVSFYNSGDEFNLLSDTLFHYNNTLLSGRYYSSISDQLNLDISATYSGYDYLIDYTEIPEQAFQIEFGIKELGLKAVAVQSPSEVEQREVGVEFKGYFMQPGAIRANSDLSGVGDFSLEDENSLEMGLFVNEKYEFSSQLSLSAGIRYSLYGNISSVTSQTYDESLPLDQSTIQDTVTLAPMDILYHGLEPRFSLRYSISPYTSLKASYNRTRQYINMLSNTVSISPIDVWKLSDEYIQPQIGDQFSVGIYKNFNKGIIETSAEVYFKNFQNILDYKIGSGFILNESVETDVLQGKGRSYGMELLVEKRTGKLSGWISYTYSRSFIKIASDFPTETINDANFFPTNYDRPHDFSLISNYKLNRRWSFSFSAKYSSGRPGTYPLSQYKLDNNRGLFYSNRNEYRIPDYFRIDVGVNLDKNLRTVKKYHGSWSLSVYNVLGRDNAYSVYFTTTQTGVRAYKLSIFDSPIPTITYNFSF